MSFKIPKGLEKFSPERVDSLDQVRDGDYVIIPSAEDAPDLRISLSTLTKWGLSCNGPRGRSHTKDSYRAARRVFGTMGAPSWPGTLEADEGSHAFVVRNLTQNKNDFFGLENSAKKTLSFAEANTIGTKATVTGPIYPFMTAKLVPVNPLYPVKSAEIRDDYPLSCGAGKPALAFDALLREIGDAGIVCVNTPQHPKCKDCKNTDLTALISVISTLYYGDSDMKTMLRIMVPDLTDNFTDGYVTSMPDFFEYARGTFVMDCSKYEAREHTAKVYAPSSSWFQDEMTLNASRKFMENILARGAVVLRIPKLEDEMAKIHASKIAEKLATRQSTMIAAAEELVRRIRRELPEAGNVVKRMKTASKKLAPDLETRTALSQVFGL